MKRATKSDTDRLIQLLQRANLPTSIPEGLDPKALIAHMRLDKKAVSGRLRLILWKALGRADVVNDVSEDAILSVLSS
jgi:3-dehydroquinate synthase